MLNTLISHRPYSLSHALWLVTARLVLVLVVGFILACFAGYVALLIVAMIVKGW